MRAALRYRDIRGRGSHIDMSLLDCQVGVLANQAMNFLASGQTPRRLGNAHPNIAPYQTFAAEDGPLLIDVGTDGQFAKLCRSEERRVGKEGVRSVESWWCQYH